MTKGVCPHCKSLILMDENENSIYCPNCHEQIFVTSATKLYSRTVTAYSRKARIALEGSSNYQSAYKDFMLLLTLKEEDLDTLFNAVTSRMYCSTLHEIYIKEATDILLKGSDHIEIDKDSVLTLSIYLQKCRNIAKTIVSATKRNSLESKYGLNLYKQAVSEYKYFLESYLIIYDALDELNQYLEDSTELLNEEIKKCEDALNAKYDLKSESEEKHPFYDDLKHKHEVTGIFPDNSKKFKLRNCFYGLMAVGFVLALTGFIMIGTNFPNEAVKYSILAVGLTFFIAGYFIAHHLRSKIYNLNY